MLNFKTIIYPLFFGALLFCTFSCQQAPSNLSVPALFSNNIVLQQNTQTAIWGNATPSTAITIKGSWGESQQAATNATGNWQTKIKTPTAGGPFKLTISAADTTIVLQEVLIGEVWLCSGQSNMEMPLKGWPPNDPIANSATEIANANYPQIRMFTVKKAIEVEATTNFSGTWEHCSPSTAPDFSATAYFFGRALHQKLKVPIGLIHTSWGGTPAEAWTEGKHLSSLGGFTEVLDLLAKAKPQQAKLENWLATKEIIDNSNIPEATRWDNLDFGDTELLHNTEIENLIAINNMPTLWENAKADVDAFDGVVVFKTAFSVPNEFVGKTATIELGAIDDMDETYINGQKIGSIQGWNVNRVYTIPKGLLKKGGNILAIRVIDTGGGGGFNGEKEAMKIYLQDAPQSTLQLGNNQWYFLPVAEYRKGKFYNYGGTLAAFKNRPKVDIDLNSHSPSVLYNGMIAPLVPYTIKGAIWYQGESNANRAKQYETLFPKMIKSWRTAWQQGDFPFYFTQIAPFNYGASNALPSAQLRDAQRKSLMTPNTGMAVTLDIGNPTNIHPANKQDVGKRLALWALAKNYGQAEMVYTGPLYQGIKIEGDKIRVTFQPSSSDLVLQDRVDNGFEIAGADGQFVPANAVVDGKDIIVSNAEISTPTQVRYAFKNASAARLFNAAGLPASSFSSEK